jgi:DNA-binding LacI/PurR family transcriptional regulator
MEERGLGSSVLHPLIEKLSKHGWQVSIDMRLPHEPSSEFLNASAVVIPVNHGYDTNAKALVKAATQAGVQPVVLGRVFPNVAAIQVDGDQIGGGRLVADYLLGQGHRHIALIGGVPGDPHSEARQKGFSDSSEAAAKIERWGDGLYTIADAHRLVTQRLAEGRRPTAIFCVSDRMALGALLALREAGLSVPHDVSLIGFDDQAEFVSISPRLSTVRLVSDGVGEQLAGMLAPATTPSRQELILSARLILRGSTAAPKDTP